MGVLQNTISVRNLTKSYGDHRVVDSASFDVAPGHITGFLGPNGAGKSTTLNMVLGLTRPDSGTATINGRPVNDHDNPAHIVGALLGTERILPGLTARGHLEWMARATRTSRTRVKELLELVGLEIAGDRRVSQLSLGMRQRLGIAAALIGDPQVLLLDEPLNGLDPEGIVWLRSFLGDFAASGKTVLLSSHLLTEMALTAHHVIIIRAGQIVADLPLSELKHQSAPRVRVKGSELGPLFADLNNAGVAVTSVEDEHEILVADMAPRDVYRRSVHLGVELDGLTLEEPGLEDIFMGLTDASSEASPDTYPGTSTHAMPGVRPATHSPSEVA